MRDFRKSSWVPRRAGTVPLLSDVLLLEELELVIFQAGQKNLSSGIAMAGMSPPSPLLSLHQAKMPCASVRPWALGTRYKQKEGMCCLPSSPHSGGAHGRSRARGFLSPDVTSVAAPEPQQILVLSQSQRRTQQAICSPRGCPTYAKPHTVRRCGIC